MHSKNLSQEEIIKILEEFENGDFSETIKSINNLLKNFPNESILFNIRGACNDGLKNYLDAVEDYKKAISIDKNYAKAYFNLAGTLLKLEKFEDSIKFYNESIKIDPKFPDSHNNLGNLYFELKDYKKAVKSFEKAFHIKPDYIEAYYSHGLSLQNLGRLNESIKSYKKVLAYKPNFSDLHNNIAILYHKINDHNSAIVHLKKALLINSDFAEAHLNIGNIYRDIGNINLARMHIKTAIRKKQDFAEALYSLGVLEMELGDLDTAVLNFHGALEINPEYLDALNNIGSVCRDLGEYDLSYNYLARAINLNPIYLEALNNLGLTQIEIGDFDSAIEKFNKVISIDKNYFYAFNNLGIAYNCINNYLKAEQCFKHAISINPKFQDAMLNLGNHMFRMDLYKDAIFYYEKYRDLKNNIGYVFGDILHAKMHLCIWDNLEKNLDWVRQEINKNHRVIGPFSLLSLIDDPELQFKATKLFANEKFSRNEDKTSMLKYSKHKKIRIGYFSADFREHPVSSLTVELYELHNRNKFEISAFSYGPDTKDEMNLRIKSAVDNFYDVRLMSDNQIVSMAKSIQLDIAVDLGGHTQDARTKIFALGVAPIQISYIGYLGTMGVKYFDYLISDEIIIPKENQRYYSEKIIYLPSFQVNNSNENQVVRSYKRSDFGLSESEFVFCCFNKTYKYTPKIIDSWARILQNVKNSTLLIYANNESAKLNLKKEITNRGIDSKRIKFGENLPMEKYLGRYEVANLFLDTHPYNAGATSSDALRMGLPVLTFLGKSFASRMGASILNAINLPELIVNSQEEYESKAIELATNSKKYKLIKDKLSKNLSETPLFDSTLFTKHLEKAYIEIYDKYQKGMKPDHIYVNKLKNTSENKFQSL